MNLLIFGDSPILKTGTAKALRYIGGGFHQAGWSVAYAGHGFDGAPHMFHAPIWPWRRGNAEWADKAIAEFQPDAVICFGDAWCYQFLPPLWKKYHSECNAPRLILYLTIDCYPFPLLCHETMVLEYADSIATTTDFGRKVIGGLIDDHPEMSHTRLHYRSHHIPLAVDKGIYNPQGRDKLHAVDRPEFIIGWVGNNQGRKHPEAAIDAVMRLKKMGVPACLWMRTTVGPAEPSAGPELTQVCSHYGARMCGSAYKPGEHDVYVSQDFMTEERLAMFYRSCDVVLSTASAGAPELPILEARACGTPVMAIDTSCFREVADVVVRPKGGQWVQEVVWHDAPDAQNIAYALYDFFNAKHRPIPNPDDVPEWRVTVGGLMSLMELPRPTAVEGITL